MTAACVRRSVFLFVLACAALGSGCQWTRQLTWNPPRETEERDQYDPATKYSIQDDSYRREVRDQRARNDAAYEASNPVGKR